MAKLKPNEKRVQLSFQRPEDLKLFAFIERESYRCRWDVQTFCIASLQEAFKDRIEEEEVSAVAEEAARKVRERNMIHVSEIGTLTDDDIAGMKDLPKNDTLKFIHLSTESTPPLSMEQAMQQAESQIAALNPPGRTLKKGKLPVPGTDVPGPTSPAR